MRLKCKFSAFIKRYFIHFGFNMWKLQHFLYIAPSHFRPHNNVWDILVFCK
uniref:Uncharacterized protein n=1 Tax=Anguilla anguilla TaxID=7936 RepID=A0A0E9PD83_ANGAN